jgi:hypothetical protein
VCVPPWATLIHEQSTRRSPGDELAPFHYLMPPALRPKK